MANTNGMYTIGFYVQVSANINNIYTVYTPRINRPEILLFLCPFSPSSHENHRLE